MHDSVSGSTGGRPQLAPGAITAHPGALAVLERAVWHSRAAVAYHRMRRKKAVLASAACHADASLQDRRTQQDWPASQAPDEPQSAHVSPALAYERKPTLTIVANSMRIITASYP